jgi:hypothetical protein
MSGSANYNLVSPVKLAISNADLPMLFGESCPSYLNNALVVGGPQGDIFSLAVLPTETLLNIGPITPLPLVHVPLCYSPLCQIPKEESLTLLAQHMLWSLVLLQSSSEPKVQTQTLAKLN